VLEGRRASRRGRTGGTVTKTEKHNIRQKKIGGGWSGREAGGVGGKCMKTVVLVSDCRWCRLCVWGLGKRVESKGKSQGSKCGSETRTGGRVEGCESQGACRWSLRASDVVAKTGFIRLGTLQRKKTVETTKSKEKRPRLDRGKN